MDEIYTKYNFNLDLVKRNRSLIVICMKYDEFLKHKEIKDLSIINLGLDLSLVLKEHPVESRNSKVIDELNNIFARVQTEHILVKNLDMLFNPEYKLNILKYFIDLSRNKLVFIEWPGHLKGRELEYSEINYPDYQRYSIDDHKIVVVK